MQKNMLVAVLACAWVSVGTSAWGQPPADCKPNSLNIPGAPYPCIYPDNRVIFRVVAPDAQKVRVRLGQGFDMSKGPDGLWYVTTTPQVVGFHYYTLSIDGAVVADPATRTFFGSGFYNSAIEVPEPDGDFYALKDVPRGQVGQRWYFSKVTGGGAVPTSTRRLTTTRIPKRNIRFCFSSTAGEKTSRDGTPRATSTSSWTT